LLATPDVSSALVSTKKLDKILKTKYDLTVLNDDLVKLANYQHLDRNGRKIVLSLKSMKTLIYKHPKDLDIFSIHRRICPVQPNPNFYQRTNCYGINNDSIFSLYDRIIQLTTSLNKDCYVTILSPNITFFNS
jgi:hypothetical protein